MKKETKKKIIIIILIISLTLNFIFLYISIIRPVFNYYDYAFWKYSCHDGCNIANNNKNLSFNETLSCWSDCDIYIDGVIEDLK